MAFQEVLTAFGFEIDKAKLAAIEKGARRTVQNFSTAAASVQRINMGMESALGWAKRIFLGYAGIQSIRFLTTDFAALADSQMKFSRATGVSLEVLGGLTHGMELSGGKAEDVNNAIQKVSKTALEASQGIKTYTRLYDTLGVAITGADGKLRGQDAILMDVADRFAEMEDGSKKVGLAMQLFGRKGRTMIPLLKKGSKGIKEMIAEAKKLGLIITPEQAKTAERFQDGLLRLRRVLTGVRNSIAVRVLPPLTKMIERMVAWWKEGNNAERAMVNLKRAGAAVTAIMIRLGAVWAFGKIRAFASALIAATVAMRQFGASALFAQIKTALIVGAMTALVVAVIDLYETTQGKETITTRLVGDPDKIEQIKQAVRRFIRFFTELWEQAKPVVFEFLKQFGLAAFALIKSLGPLFKEIGLAILQIAAALGPAYGILLKAIVQVLAALFKAIKPLMPFLRSFLVMWVKLITGPLRIFVFMLRIAGRLLEIVVKLITAIARATEFLWGPGLRFIMRMLTGITNALGAIGSLIELALVDPVEAARQAWEALADFFTGFWDSLKTAAKVVGAVLATVFGGAAAAVKKAWDAALGGIKRVVMGLVNTVMFAVNALRALAGQKAGGALKKGAKAAAKRGRAATSDEAVLFRALGAPVPAAGPTTPIGARDPALSGSIAPVPALAARGGAPVDRSLNVRNDVGGIKVEVISNAADPEAVGSAVDRALTQKIERIFTDTSRDLRKPTGGQT